jgi:IgA Peptidase M64
MNGRMDLRAYAAAVCCFCVSIGIADDDTVVHCWASETGEYTGVHSRMHAESRGISSQEGLPSYATSVLLDNGEAQGQIDLVFMGDGYTEDELDSYRERVDKCVEWIFAVEPFTSYRSKFNIHRIDVVSNESGVDNDPTRGVDRDTALGMHFWCNDIQRAVCVDFQYTRSLAESLVEEADQIIVLGNSTTYGGAASFGTRITCVTGQDSSVRDVVVHELGHSFGLLGDEYTYGGPTVYNGIEPNRVNLTTHEETSMLDLQTKWHLWSGESFAGFDGLVGNYEGGGYSSFGIFRPSANSRMRTSARPFNMPSVEALINWFYIYSDGIETPTIFDSPELSGHEANIDVVFNHPTSHDLRVIWQVNQVTIAGAERTGFSACEFQLQPGRHLVTVQAFDDTPWVRDPLIIDQSTRSTRYWFVNIDTYPGDANGDGVINFFDIAFYINAFASNDPAADLAEPKGAFNIMDISAFIDRVREPCQ